MSLKGIRIVDFGQWIAGPLAAMLLADQGAEVVHIDPPGGPRWQTPANAMINRGKAIATLDLKNPSENGIAGRLVRSADVVIENFRPGVMSRIGLDADLAVRENPSLIYCSLPGFAGDDPRAALPAWEGVVGAATAAYRPIPGIQDGAPMFTPLTISSAYAAIAAATAVVMALIARDRDGLGQRIEVALFDATFLAVGATGLLVNGSAAGGRPDDPWGGRFLAVDGKWMRLSLATPRFVRRFIETAGLQEWTDRGYLETGRLKRGSALRQEQQQALIDLFRTRTGDEWEALGRLADVPLTRERSGGEWMNELHAREAGIAVPVQDPGYSHVLQPGLAVQLSETPGRVHPRRFISAAELSQIVSRWEHERGAQAETGAAAVAPKAALDGVRVVDVTQVLAGPTAGRTLGEYGADVVKINNPREEGAGYRWSIRRYHTDVNRGKRTLLVDLKTMEGNRLFWRMLEGADLLMQNFRRPAADRLGITYEQVKARRPDIVYCSVSMYGGGGPWSELPGYEVNAQTVSGMTQRMGGLGQPFAVNDYATGLLGAFGAGLALFHRQRTGSGQAVEVALARTASLLQAPYLVQSAEGTSSAPGGVDVRGPNYLQRLYRASDNWFFLGAKPSQLADLKAVAAPADGGECGEGELEERFAKRTAAVWVETLSAAGIGAAATVTPDELMTDPWVLAHGLSITSQLGDGDRITTIGPPARLSRTPVRPGRPVPAPGADAREILEELGMASELDRLVAEAVISLA